jgi:hypothetical protein
MITNLRHFVFGPDPDWSRSRAPSLQPMLPLFPTVLHWPSMRTLAVLVIGLASIVSVGCNGPDGVHLQAPLQGEWSNFHNDKNQVSMDARKSPEKQPAEK